MAEKRTFSCEKNPKQARWALPTQLIANWYTGFLSHYSPVIAINEVNCISVVPGNTYYVITVDPGGWKEGWSFEPRLETFIRLNNFLNTINDLINAHFQMNAPYLMPPPPPCCQSCIRPPSLINAPYETYYRFKFIPFIQFLA